MSSSHHSKEERVVTVELHPSLYYHGNASEAMDFMAEHLEGKVDCKLTFGMGHTPVAEEYKDCIMHGVVSFKGHSFYISDAVGGLGTVGSTTTGTNVRINLVWSDLPAMTKAFEGLSSGGMVTMPLAKQVWGAHYGAFIDKFEVPWSFLYQDPDAADWK